MIVATLLIPDERYATRRPTHIHRRYADSDVSEAWSWIRDSEDRLGWIDIEISEMPQTLSWRCPQCGWQVP